MKILISAYECQPHGGSEGGHGWFYPSELAKRGHEVHVVVPSEWGEAVTNEIVRRPVENLNFHFVPAHSWPMRLGWTAGSAMRYFLWQWDAASQALRLDAAHDFDVVHHVSYGTIMAGSFMWRLGKPFVFGPAGGGQTAPRAFLGYFGPFRRSEMLRTVITKRLWWLDWPAILTARASSIVLAANQETALLAERMGARRVVPMLCVYLPDHMFDDEKFPVRPAHEPVKLLWVGRLLARKGHQLAAEALGLVPPSVSVAMEIVGDGPMEHGFETWLAAAGLAHPVTMRGRIPWQWVHEAYRDADVLIFTSLRDTVGVQLLEAMAQGLPVITLDHQGAADLVTDGAGIKIPVTTPSETRQGIADAIGLLVASRDLRLDMAERARRRAADFSLSKRITDVERIYALVRSEPGATRRRPRWSQARA
jgi:glycosyltransferase involved in cell wall biosynthesis